MRGLGIVLWIVFSFVVAAGARNRGRSGLAWFFFSLVFSPLLAGLTLVILGRKRRIWYDMKDGRDQ